MKRRELLAGGLALGALGGCAGPAALERVAAVSAAPHTLLRRIGFASCLDQTLPQELVAHLAQQPFDLFLFGGDNVYYGTPRHGSLRQAYARAAALPAYTKLRAKPHMAVWDDNDYSGGDAGAEFAAKQDAKEQFLAFWQVPTDDERRSREGLYQARTFGPAGRRVQVILLDTRWFRSRIARRPRGQRAPGEGGYIPDTRPDSTLLGAAQWAWLQQQLREPADLRIVVSSIQVLAQGHSYERWGNLPAERERLMQLLAAAGTRNTVLLSGDRHFAALYEHTQGFTHPLVELTSSGVTHFWPEPTDAPGDTRARLLDRNYAELVIDWQRRELSLAARNLAGDQRIARILSFGAST